MSVPDRSIDPRLLASAQEEFQRVGFLKAELKTICKNAGITTGALYKRYKGKEELFCAVVKDTTDALDRFIDSRSNVDFSNMSDEELINSWKMDEKHTLELFKTLWEFRDGFTLLIDKAAGTRYENYQHDFSFRMTKAYLQFYKAAKDRGLVKGEISKEEMHILCSSFWTAVYEPFIHGMSWNDIETHCKVICRFFDWTDAIEIN